MKKIDEKIINNVSIISSRIIKMLRLCRFIQRPIVRQRRCLSDRSEELLTAGAIGATGLGAVFGGIYGGYEGYQNGCDTVDMRHWTNNDSIGWEIGKRMIFGALVGTGIGLFVLPISLIFVPLWSVSKICERLYKNRCDKKKISETSSDL
jgi:MFS family permease